MENSKALLKAMRQGFTLDDWCVEPLAGCFKKQGHSVHVEPKVMDVLLCLVRAEGETVTRTQLLDDVWRGLVVSEEVLTRAVSQLRSLLGDTAREKRYIRTIPKRGYALIMNPAPLQPDVEITTVPEVEEATCCDTTVVAGGPETTVSADQQEDVFSQPWYGHLIQQFLQLLTTIVQTFGKVAVSCVLALCGLLALLIVVAMVTMEELPEISLGTVSEGERAIVEWVLDRIDNKLTVINSDEIVLNYEI